jgi:DNA-binding NarL/FixJ family response regulator
VSGWSELPRRQQQIATYVARGLTSKQIAAELARNSTDIDARMFQLMRAAGSKDIPELRLWVAEQRPSRLGFVNLTDKDPDVDNKDHPAVD